MIENQLQLDADAQHQVETFDVALRPSYCCERGELLQVLVCPECAEASQAYSAAMRDDALPVTEAPPEFVEHMQREAEKGSLTTEDARAILQVLRSDKRLPQPTVDAVGGINVTATREEAQVIAQRVWWRTKLFKPEGLAHLFPGLAKRRGATSAPKPTATEDSPSHPSSGPRKVANRAARRRAAKLSGQNPSV